jgi:serine/threonine-protein kinase
VLYELLTGRVAFAGQTIPDTLAATLDREPDWGAIPGSTPTQVQRLLRRCLAKDIRQRLRDVGDPRLYLDEVPGDADADSLTRRSNETPPSIRRWAVMGLAAAAFAAGSDITWMLPRAAPRSEAPGAARRTIGLVPGQELDTRGGAGPLAIAPDGRQVAYVANGGRAAQLHLRSVESFDARPISATEGAQFPYFSPDCEWVAFFADRKLKRVAVRGGSPVTICDVAVIGQGGAWGPDGTIVFDPGDYGLMRVPASGGVPQRITIGDDAIDRSHLSWPHFLPSGRSLIATVGPLGASDSYLVALALDKREWRRLTAGSQAQYLRPGYLVYHAPAVQERERAMPSGSTKNH